MHELALAQDLVRAVERALDAHGAAGKVTLVRVSVGRLAGVVPESLRFAFDSLVGSTRLAGAQLELTVIAPRVKCAGCGVESEAAPDRLTCPACGSIDADLVAGREFVLTSFDVDDGEKP